MTSPRPQREITLDFAKGIAILAIVVGHVLRGLSAAGVASPFDAWYEEVETALYLVHLGVFFLLAGVMVPRAVERHGAGPYLRDRAALLLWLFVLWTGLQGSVQVVLSGSTNSTVAPPDLLVGLVRPLGQLWFLPSLLLFTVVAAALAPWRSRPRAAVALALTGAVSLARFGIEGSSAPMRDLGLLVFFVAGAALGFPRLASWLRSRAVWPVAGTGLVCFVLVCWLADPTRPPDSFDPRTVGSVALGVVASLGGVVAVLGLARLLAAWRPAGAGLSFLGVRSLEIFLAHILATAGTRIVLLRLGIDDLGLHLLLGTLVGVGAPLVLAALAPRLGSRWLFTAPAWLRPGDRPTSA